MAGNDGAWALFAFKSNILYCAFFRNCGKQEREGLYVVNKIDKRDTTALIVMFYSCRL